MYISHVDPSVPTYTKIPSYPLPLSWAHIIKPFGTAKVEPSAFRYLEAPLPTLDKATVKKLGNNYQGIYIDAPIHLGDDPSPPAGSISMKELVRTLSIFSMPLIAILMLLIYSRRFLFRTCA